MVLRHFLKCVRTGHFTRLRKVCSIKTLVVHLKGNKYSQDDKEAWVVFVVLKKCKLKSCHIFRPSMRINWQWMLSCWCIMWQVSEIMNSYFLTSFHNAFLKLWLCWSFVLLTMTQLKKNNYNNYNLYILVYKFMKTIRRLKSTRALFKWYLRCLFLGWVCGFFLKISMKKKSS